MDRKEAIKKALQLAKPGDVVIITGVGHQRSLNIGGREVSWSDQETVKDLIKFLPKS
jgi:UDP-N-acetylmuramoyl-L-alanyl-D-glutamate--2,6-diaminopimelate ligase